MDARRVFLAAAVAFLPALLPIQASAQTASLNAVLLGGNECDGVAPPTGPKCRKGDDNGFGLAALIFPSSGVVCVTLQVDNIDTPDAAHIHPGKATFNGAPILTLPTPVASLTGFASAGCVALSQTTIQQMRANPANYYVNVHTGLFPGGAVRGQLQ
jgi:hypothetical protein